MIEIAKPYQNVLERRCGYFYRRLCLPPPRIWAHLGGRYWSAKIDDISLWPPNEIIPIWFEERPVVETLLSHSLDMKIEILNIANPNLLLNCKNNNPSN